MMSPSERLDAGTASEWWWAGGQYMNGSLKEPPSSIVWVTITIGNLQSVIGGVDFA